MRGSFNMNMNLNKKIYRPPPPPPQPPPPLPLKTIAPNIYMFSAPNPTRSFAQLDFGKGVGSGCGK